MEVEEVFHQYLFKQFLVLRSPLELLHLNNFSLAISLDLALLRVGAHYNSSCFEYVPLSRRPITIHRR